MDVKGTLESKEIDMALRQTNILLEDELINAAKAVALANGISMAELTRRALREYLAWSLDDDEADAEMVA